MQNAYIVAATRTPIGKFGGGLKDVSPVDLGAHVMSAIIQKTGIPHDALDLYIMGNVLRSGHGQLLPRQAAIKAGISVDVDGYAIDMVCSSGMMAVMNAAMMIKAGEADLVMAGGMESMSQTGFSLSARARWGYKYLSGRPEQVQDVLEVDGLLDPITHESMGAETDRLSAEYGITRAEVDQVAYQSQQRAAQATANGLFQPEITPFEVKTRKGATLITADEGIRASTTPESLAGLRAAFSADGILTAGNASQLSDGAACLLIASEKAIKTHNLTPIARLVGSSWAAVESWRFVEAPVPALRKLFKKHNLSAADIDLYENNEAFATNSVLFNKVFDIPYEKLNIYGGGISLGHPIGATGARLFVTLLNALEQTGGKRGVASLCHGVGGGTAVLVEKV